LAVLQGEVLKESLVIFVVAFNLVINNCKSRGRLRRRLLERDDSDFFFLDGSHSSFNPVIFCKRSDRTVAYGLMFSSVHLSFMELILSNSWGRTSKLILSLLWTWSCITRWLDDRFYTNVARTRGRS